MGTRFGQARQHRSGPARWVDDEDGGNGLVGGVLATDLDELPAHPHPLLAVLAGAVEPASLRPVLAGRVEGQQALVAGPIPAARMRRSPVQVIVVGCTPGTSVKAAGNSRHRPVVGTSSATGSRRRWSWADGRRSASIRRAPSRTISSSAARISARPSSSVTTLNIGVPSSPALQRRLSSFWFNEEGTSRLRTNRRSTGSGHTSVVIATATSWPGLQRTRCLHCLAAQPPRRGTRIPRTWSPSSLVWGTLRRLAGGPLA